jgi:N-acetylglucosamine kinase-like BadF-type ATPase
MAMGRHFVGIDGGSSKTVGVALDEHGSVRARGVGGPGNYHTVGLGQVEANVFGLIAQLVEETATSVGDVAGFCFALAGIWREADRRAIGGMLEHRGIRGRSTLMSDVEALIAAAEGEGPILAIVAGTGSVVLGRGDDGRLHKVGGGGHLLDDNGSGYDIGISGLRAVLEASDGRGPATPLSDALLAAAGLGSTDGIVPWLYGLPDQKREVAQLAPAVIEAASRGDAAAAAILERAADDLARWAAVAAEALQAGDRPVRVVLAGGVLEQSDLYRRLVTERITRALPHAQIGLPQREPAHSAALIALRTWGRQHE